MQRTISTSLILITLAAGAAVAGRESHDYPIYANGGVPDLTVDAHRFTSQMEIVDRVFDPVADRCAVDEGVIGGTGVRRLLRFDTVIVNVGDGDLVVGRRDDSTNPYAPYFFFGACHGHYHIRDFSVYELLTPDGQVVVTGHKQGFCFEDSFKYGPNRSSGYDCVNQGITSGWGDWYYKQLVGQWIDITGVPEGDYIVRVRINLGADGTGIFPEGQNRAVNQVETRIHIPGPRHKVALATD